MDKVFVELHLRGKTVTDVEDYFKDKGFTIRVVKYKQACTLEAMHKRVTLFLDETEKIESLWLES